MSVKYFKNNFNIIMLYRNLYAFKFDINEIKEKIFHNFFRNYNITDFFLFRIFLDSCLLLFNKEKMEKSYFKKKFKYNDYIEKLLKDFYSQEYLKNLEEILFNSYGFNIDLLNTKMFYFDPKGTNVNLYDTIKILRDSFAHMQYGNFTGVSKKILFYGIYNKDKGKLKTRGIIIEPIVHKFIETFFSNNLNNGIPYKHSFITKNCLKNEIFFNEVTYKGNTLYNGVDYHLMKDKIFGKRNFKELKEFLNINNNELDLKKKLIDETDFKKFKAFTENLLARNPIDEEIEYTIKAFYDFETEFSNFLYHLIQLNDRIIEYHLPEYKTQQDLIMKSINELEEDKTSWIMFKIFFDFLFLVNIVLRNQEYYMSPIDIKKINPYGFEKDDKAMVNYINKKIIEGKIEENNAKYGNVYYILERIRNAIMHGNIKILLENNNILLKFLDKYNSREDVLSIELNKLKNFIFFNDWSYDK